MFPLSLRQMQPFKAATLVLSSDFIAILAIRILFEGRFYLTRWWSYKIGDSIALPLYTFFCLRALENDRLSGRFYDRKWFPWVLLGLGASFSIALEVQAVLNHFRRFQGEFLPSQAYHTVIFAVMFAWMSDTILPLLTAKSSRDKYIALVFLALYLATWGIDNSPLQDHSPEREPRVW